MAFKEIVLTMDSSLKKELLSYIKDNEVLLKKKLEVFAVMIESADCCFTLYSLYDFEELKSLLDERRICLGCNSLDACPHAIVHIKRDMCDKVCNNNQSCLPFKDIEFIGGEA